VVIDSNDEGVPSVSGDLNSEDWYSDGEGVTQKVKP
jgi:hypothetical protein